MNDRHQIAPYPIRMPQELRARLEEAAKDGNRSLHAEIVARLQQSFDGQSSGTSYAPSHLAQLAGKLHDLQARRNTLAVMHMTMQKVANGQGLSDSALAELHGIDEQIANLVWQIQSERKPG